MILAVPFLLFPCRIWICFVRMSRLKRRVQALFSMQNLKSLGLGGFHPLFFKSQWDVLRRSLYDFVRRCFADPRTIQGVNHTLLSVLPKCDDPVYVAQFRPLFVMLLTKLLLRL